MTLYLIYLLAAKARETFTKQLNMSQQYDKLKQPLFCRWMVRQNEVCGQSFVNAKLFALHLRSQHVSQYHLPTISEEECPKISVTCGWKGCETLVFCRTVSECLLHVLAHPYHNFLKSLGREFQEKHKLPKCLYESTYADNVQPLEMEPRCLWDDGGCDRSFDDIWEFYNHVHDHIRSKDSGGICRWKGCKFSGRDRNKVLEHCRSHLQEKVVACPNCGTHFSNNTKLKDHLNRQSSTTPDKSFPCTYCHKVFPNQRLLREHARKHVNTIKCPHCELTCQGPSRLIQHIRYRHESSKSFQCPLCNNHYKTSQSLAVHIETHGDFRVMCQFPGCHFVAKSERVLRIHLNYVHRKTDARNFCCHICNLRFHAGRNLTVHLKTKHGFKLPPGHCRFRYIEGKDGHKRLQTVRLDDEHIYTPEVNTFTANAEDASEINLSECDEPGEEDCLSSEDDYSSSQDDFEASANVSHETPSVSTPDTPTPGSDPNSTYDLSRNLSSANTPTTSNFLGHSSGYLNLSPDSPPVPDSASSPKSHLALESSLTPDPPASPDISTFPDSPSMFDSPMSRVCVSPTLSNVLVGSTRLPAKIADAIQLLPDILLDDQKF